MRRVFADYQVLDHLFRIEKGTYRGKYEWALSELYAKALSRDVTIFMSEMTQVEMIIGTENPSLRPSDQKRIAQKDRRKLELAAKVRVRWLAYPCSKFDDEYSRLDVSFRFAGEDSEVAEALERRLLAVDGVSAGDARQIVSCVYGWDDDDPDAHPGIEWVVSEDQKLVRALTEALADGALRELSQFQIGNVSDFIASIGFA